MLNKANKYFAQKAKIKALPIEFFKDFGLNSVVAELVLQNGQPKSIRVNICRVLDSQIIGLAHEYVHCWQILKGKLQIHDNKEFWYGKECLMPYVNRPHEIEAGKLQFAWFKNFNSLWLTF